MGLTNILYLKNMDLIVSQIQGNMCLANISNLKNLNLTVTQIKLM
jgi:hypothetical protein